MKLLVVEDNPRLAERIKHKLKRIYAIDVAETAHDSLEKVKDIEYDVILLDLGLPDMSGLEVCKQLRIAKINTPILILTGVDDMDTRVSLLNSGADDYVTKPFHSEELLARISALARRRARNAPRTIIHYQDLIIDIEERKVTRAGAEIYLRRKEFDILEYLVTNKGRVLTRDMIMNHVWDGDRVSWNSTIDVHIKHLRDKVDRPFASAIIKTAYGLGYRVDSLEKHP